MTLSANSLNFKRILICRPWPEALSLKKALVEKGVEVFLFPTLELQPLKDATIFHDAWQGDPSVQFIFVSPNAVRYSFDLMTEQQQAQCQQAICFAVGTATAAALKERGVVQVISPDPVFNSEALLSLPELQNVQGQSYLIVASVEGRDLIESTLLERGAIVNKLISYTVSCPRLSSEPLIQTWKEQPFDCIVVTSQKMLENLWQLLGKDQTLLQATPITIMSPRIQAWACSHGIHQGLLIANASTEAILESFHPYIV